jgi:methanogenic corrinoid protein MtbC1
MASMRAFAEVGSDWGGCGRDCFDISTLTANVALSRSKVANGSRKLLTHAIEAEIIPRLILAHQQVLETDVRDELQCLSTSGEQVVEFVGLLLSNDVTVASAYIENLCARGARLETIFLHLFTPAARVLGRLWEEDVCDFSDVTIALSRLQQLLRELGAAFEIEPMPAQVGRKALLMAAPGDQHTFGVFMLGEFFRRAGWDVRGGGITSKEELFGLVESDRYDLVGLSASNEVPLDGFAAVIQTIRKVTPSPRLQVMVGGRFFLEHPEAVSGVGADASAQDGRRAVLKVSSLLGTNALR